jgi:hypothetical protein
VNYSHLHLLLNHAPTVGSVVALGLLILGLIRRSEALKLFALEVIFVVAIVTLPVYTTGVAAHREELRDRPDISATAVSAHHDAALAGFVVTEFAGFVAWIALWQSRRRARAGRGVVGAVLLLLVVAIAVMGRAATLGGEIRHPEIRAATSGAAIDADRFVTNAISELSVTSRWAWPAAEAVHFLGLSLSLGVLLAVNLRILGVMKQVPFADVHRLLPWGMLGFGVNLITGMFFFVGQPGQYTDSPPFWWKVIFLMIAAGNFLYLTVFSKGWATDRLESSIADKAMAITSIAAWLGVLYAGRMLPFLGDAF